MDDLDVGRSTNEAENCLQILVANLMGRTLKWFIFVVRTALIRFRIGADGGVLLT